MKYIMQNVLSRPGLRQFFFSSENLRTLQETKAALFALISFKAKKIILVPSHIQP